MAEWCAQVYGAVRGDSGHFVHFSTALTSSLECGPASYSLLGDLLQPSTPGPHTQPEQGQVLAPLLHTPNGGSITLSHTQLHSFMIPMCAPPPRSILAPRGPPACPQGTPQGTCDFLPLGNRDHARNSAPYGLYHALYQHYESSDSHYPHALSPGCGVR